MVERLATHPTGPHGSRALASGGEMGARIRSFGWSTTPLGPSQQWPLSLRLALNLCLRSRFQLAIYWGPGLVLLYNDAERDVLGAMHPHALGRPAAEILADNWSVLGPMLHGVVATGEATWSEDQVLWVNRHGYVEEVYFTYSYSPIPDGGGVGGVLLVSFETTQRVLAERRLRTLRELAAETSRAPTAEVVCRLAAGVLADNPSDLPFCLLYLLDGATARLCACAGVEGDADPEQWPLREAAATQQAVLVEDVPGRLPWASTPLPRSALVLPVVHSDKGPVAGFLVAGISDFRALDEAYRGFLGLVAVQIATAIAAARALQEESSRAEALAAFDSAKTAFFENVSHELRTPLSLLLGPLTDCLTSPDSQLSSADRERLGMAHRNGLRLHKLVNTLLEFSRIQAGRVQAAREETELGGLTAELASMFRSRVEQAGMRLVVDCPPLPRPAFVDRDMWETIVLNLLSNAVKFTHEGEIAVSLRQAGAEVELSVSDTGVGIPDEERPRLFERFHQISDGRRRAVEGTGIGLALVQELVRLHGGSIRLESRRGPGSTFVVSIPLGSAAPAAHEVGGPAPLPGRAVAPTQAVEAIRRLADGLLPPNGAAAPAGSQRHEGVAGSGQEGAVNHPAGEKARVLVVDDNPDMRQYLGRLLSAAYAVESVHSAEAALAAARGGPPDLVLADVMLPAMDGFALLRELRADGRTATVPVVLLSARAGEESRLQGLNAGADDYLLKPFSARELLARVSAHLEMARVRREAAQRENELRAQARQAQEHAAAILESITDGFIALDGEWRFTHVNAEAERINAMRREDVIGKVQWEVFPATLGTAFEFGLRRARSEQVPVQFENYYQPWDCWYHVKAYPGKDGGLSVFFHDITQQKRTEEALRKTHGELEHRVHERTQEISRANARLEEQITRRRRVERARSELLRRLVRTQEEEHRRIARELHDDLTQQLAVLAIDAGTLEQLPGCAPEVGARARAIREQLASLSESVHSLSRQLHPSILDDLGLVDALRSECLSLEQRDGILVDYRARDVPAELPRDMALCVYRVAQEALRNVVRHARCASATVRLVASERELVLRVKDAGVGFDVGARGKAGLGLQSMRERVRLIHARLSVRSGLGKGTQITIHVPLNRSQV